MLTKTLIRGLTSSLLMHSTYDRCYKSHRLDGKSYANSANSNALSTAISERMTWQSESSNCQVYSSCN